MTIAIMGSVGISPYAFVGVLERYIQCADAFLYLCGESARAQGNVARRDGQEWISVARRKDGIFRNATQIFDQYQLPDLSQMAKDEENALSRNNPDGNLLAHWAEKQREFLAKAGSKLMDKLNTDEFRTHMVSWFDTPPVSKTTGLSFSDAFSDVSKRPPNIAAKDWRMDCYVCVPHPILPDP